MLNPNAAKSQLHIPVSGSRFKLNPKKNSSASARSSGHTPSRSTHEGSTNDACAASGKAQKTKRSEREAMDTRIGLAFGKKNFTPPKIEN